MIIRIDYAAKKSYSNEVIESLLFRPLRVCESIGAPSTINLVTLNPFFFAACGLRPKPLFLLACFWVGCIPRVVFISGWDMTEEEYVTGFACERQAEALHLGTWQVAHCKIFHDQV